MAKRAEDVSVLLVDDNDVDVMGVKRAFSKSRLENAIVVAADGREALDKLRDGKSIRHPYIVLLDLNMPRMSGIEFLAEARRDPALHASIIFVMTTSSRAEDREAAYAHNVAGYIVKGAHPDSYLDTVSLFSHYTQIVELP